MVGERLEPAIRGMENELRDDLADVEAATRAVADSEYARDGLRANDPDLALQAIGPFHDNYPDLDLLLFRPDGTLPTQRGCLGPPQIITQMVDLPPLPERE